MRNLDIKKAEEFISVLLVILSGFAVTAVYKMSNFLTFPNLDEMLWHSRSRIFWDKFLNWDFSGLVQSAQPGITVYWFTGFMTKLIDFNYNYVNVLIDKKASQGLDFNSVVNSNSPDIFKLYEPISFAFNTPMLILLVVFFISFYYLLRKLGFNRIISVFSVLFVTNNVYFVYWNTPSDKMLNIFLVLSFLTFLVYVYKKGGKRYFFVSSILAAFAVLSKLSALIVIPFYFLVLILYSWPLDKNKIMSLLKDFLIWIIFFFIIIIVFLPTIITNFSEVLLLFSNNNDVYEANHSVGGYLTRANDYPKLFSIVILFYPVTWIFFVLYIILRVGKYYHEKFSGIPTETVRMIGMFVLLFSVMVFVVSRNHDTRFMSPAFMLVNIVSACGFYAVMEIIIEKIKASRSIYYAASIVFVGSTIFSIISNSELVNIALKKALQVE